MMMVDDVGAMPVSEMDEGDEGLSER